jgi:hypothetical protein
MTTKKVERRKGARASAGALGIASLAAISVTSLGLWLPLLGERYVFAHDPGSLVIEHSDTTIRIPSLDRYPLLRLVSRITRGATFHHKRQIYLQSLPPLLQYLDESKFIEAESYVISLFQKGLFEEILLKNDTFMFDMQQELKIMAKLHLEADELTQKLAAFASEEKGLRLRMVSKNSKFREFLHLPSSDLIDLEEFYEIGPLRGTPRQPELETPEDLKTIARFIYHRLSNQEKRSLTDEYVSEGTKEWREVFQSLKASLHLNQKGAEGFEARLGDITKDIKARTYLLQTKLMSLAKDYATPPEIMGAEYVL